MLIHNTNGNTGVSGYSNETQGVAQVAAHSAHPDLPKVAVKPVDKANETQPTEAQLKHAVEDINGVMKKQNSNVEFSIDKGTRQPVIKVVDSQTGQLISQFPSKEILAVSQMIGESQHGFLVKQQA